MRHAIPVRKALRFRTLFNLLGPLTNPANAEFQLLGASRIATAEKLAQASAKLGRQRVLVVCGHDQLDDGNANPYFVSLVISGRPEYDGRAARPNRRVNRQRT